MFDYRPYVTVGERRRQAEKLAKKMAAQGRIFAPIQIEGRAISKTFWGKAWCENLESYSDYENRLPRGRNYARNGSVIDLQIAAGKITALVYGSELYEIEISITALAANRWNAFKKGCAGKVTNLLDLLQGRLSKDILADITARGAGLFPTPAEIKLKCSCPDWAGMCKHVAAALYGVGARLDEKPDLFFSLRGLDMEELITAAGAAAAAPLADAAADAGALAGADLAAIFGVEMDTGEAAPPPRPAAKPRTLKKPAAKKPPAKPPKKKPPRAAGKKEPIRRAKPKPPGKKPKRS